MKQFIFIISSIFICFLSSAQELKNVLAEEITAEEFSIALAAMPMYNHTLDTLISNSEIQIIKSLAASCLEDWEIKWLEGGDLILLGEGRFPTNEYFTLVWEANDQDAFFISPDMRTVSRRILGSYQGVYSKENIYAGYKTFDCDGYIHIRFCDTPKLGEKRLIAIYKNFDMWTDWSDSTPSMVWYKEDLYCRWKSIRLEDRGSLHFFKLHIDR